MEDFVLERVAATIEIRWRPGVVIGPAELDVLANTLTHVPGWTAVPILIHLGLIRHITLPARTALLQYRHLGPIGLVGNDPVDRVIAAFITQSRSRTRYFEDVTDAQAWLASVGDPAPAPVPEQRPVPVR
ncbi:hypothetical protein AC792_06575 [Arthrobacter sp. RIT-PI-e]|uniref:hypothetical protein n=1 Tax=Arthrobacter sp. RIT-PI-e TaxID=1681197 RepID=UPI0006762243|nr:hypothetical protein [Arthrobacter sp. RIT-PI-e]KNC19392.1 hypothetical protein AC792_06575 [Arthrobacter sp. RIT-PI-e]